MDTKAILSRKNFKVGVALIVTLTVALLPVYIAAILKLLLWVLG